MKSNRARISALVAIIAVAAFSACQRPAANEVAMKAVPMRIVRDDLDREILVPTKVTRVVSTAPSVTEMIFAAGGGDRLVGVTTFCNYPEQAKSIAKIGDTMNPNIESIVALKADIVFVSTASQIEAVAKTLEANGIAVYVTNPSSLDGVMKNLTQFGVIFATDDVSSSFVSKLDDRVQAVRTACNTIPATDETLAEYDRRVKTVRVFVQVSKEPLFTIGKTAFLNDLLECAGGRSVTANVESAYPKLSKETALALNPDAIILSESDDNRGPNEVFKNSPAVKNGRVYKINADIISRPGPRLVDALEQIAKLLHPEKFN